MTPLTATAAIEPKPAADEVPQRSASKGRSAIAMIALFLGAVVFLFPFYYMLVGSLQTTPDTTVPAPSRRRPT